jgi:hypothetical protein
MNISIGRIHLGYIGDLAYAEVIAIQLSLVLKSVRILFLLQAGNPRRRAIVVSKLVRRIGCDLAGPFPC